MRIPVPLRHAGQTFQQPPVVGLVPSPAVRPFGGGEAPGPDTGAAVERVHAQTGVIRQDRQTRPPVKVLRLRERVEREGLEGLEFLFLLPFREAQLHRPEQPDRQIGEKIPDFPELVNAARGDQNRRWVQSAQMRSEVRRFASSGCALHR